MGIMEDWERRRLETYYREFDLGLHDRDCEQQERSGLCHCSKRRRELAGQTELPVLAFAMPICGGCNEEVDHDGDVFHCDNCKVAWSSFDASDGSRADHFSDEYGDLSVRAQFGERLIVLATAREHE